MIIELFEDGKGILHGNGQKLEARFADDSASGFLGLGTERIPLNGVAIPSIKSTGNQPCYFVTEDGKVFDCGIVNIDNGQIKPVHRETETVIKLKRENEAMKKQIADLESRLVAIEKRMNYTALDFLK